MLHKTDKHQYYFDVQLNWRGDKEGIITANDVKDTIIVATPLEFAGGVPDKWSPEHLFLASLSSCMMTTYLAFADKYKLSISHFECNAIGQVLLKEGHLEFNSIDIFPKVLVSKEEDLPLANEILLKTYKHCIIANSVKAQLVQHGVAVVDKHPQQRNEKQEG